MADAPVPPCHSSERLAAAALALVGLTALGLGRVLGNGFVNYDDPQYVTSNPHVRDGLSWAGTRWAMTSMEALNWHPLTWLSLQADCHFFGPVPSGPHLTSLLLHTANALLLFFSLHCMTGAIGRSWLVAALFAIHPLHVESVAWVAERKDVLSTFFGMLSLWAYLHYVRQPRPGPYLLVAVALALGLMAKPTLVTWPCCLLLLDFWPLGRLPLDWRALFRRPPLPLVEKLPLLVLSGACCVMTILAQNRGGAIESLQTIPLGQRLGNAVVSYVWYMAKTFWPTDLAVFYPHPGKDLPAAEVAAAAVVLVAITSAVLLRARRQPYLVVGWLWYLGTLLPMIGLVQVGEQARADRYTYIPLIGLFLGLVWGAADLAATRPFVLRLAPVAVAGALLACVALTWRQAGYWKNSRTLWRHALEAAGGSYVAHNNLARALLDETDKDSSLADSLRESEQHSRAAMQLRPDAYRPYVNLGEALDRMGKQEEAIGVYRQALHIEPSLPVTRQNLGRALARQGRLEEAVRELREAVRLAPDLAEANSNLARALLHQNKPREALPFARHCVDLDPDNGEYQQMLDRILRQTGHRPAARTDYPQVEQRRTSRP